MIQPTQNSFFSPNIKVLREALPRETKRPIEVLDYLKKVKDLYPKFHTHGSFIEYC